MTSFRALGELLLYPTENTVDGVPEIEETLAREGLLEAPELLGIGPLLRELASLDLYELQERYVGLFDQSRSLSLDLFEHEHGDSRSRGPAMVELESRYRAEGLELSAPVLPDFLPVFLEYLSELDVSRARAELAPHASTLKRLARRLEDRGSAYAAVLRALAGLAAPGPESVAAASAPARPGGGKESPC